MLDDKLNRLVTSIRAELRDLGINPLPQRSALTQLIKRFEDGPVVIAGVQMVPGDKELRAVKYGVTFERHKVQNIPYFYGSKLAVSLVGTAGLNHIFDLKGDEYFSLRQAANLLCGRSVYKLSFSEGGIKPHWYQLGGPSSDSQGNSVMQKFPYIAGRVEQTLDVMPVKGLPAMRESIVDSLFDGDRVSVVWSGDENIKKVFLEVQPRGQAIAAFSTLDSTKQNIKEVFSSRKSQKPKK